MKIYTDATNHVDVQVSEGNKWYTYLLPKDKGLYMIVGDSVKKVVVKAYISNNGKIIPSSTIEASFKGSNTSNLTDMGSMFYYCSSLETLDLSGWDTSNVTNMSNMFYPCKGITSLDISSFDTSNVTNMDSMFSDCRSLTSLDLSKFKTSKVTNMNSMFGFCMNLELLDLSGWDTSKVTNMGSMFSACNSLRTIKMVDCSEATIKKITDVKPSSATIVTE